MRQEIDALVADHALVLFGWSTCWFCTDAERQLKDANLPYRSVYMDLWKPGGPYHDHAVGDDGSLAAKRAKNIRKATNPLQAELALLAGRCTVPVVVVRGKVLDGDEQHGSVVEAIASGELARAVSDSSPWAPAWPSSPPPPPSSTARRSPSSPRPSARRARAPPPPRRAPPPPPTLPPPPPTPPPTPPPPALPPPTFCLTRFLRGALSPPLPLRAPMFLSLFRALFLSPSLAAPLSAPLSPCPLPSPDGHHRPRRDFCLRRQVRAWPPPPPK